MDNTVGTPDLDDRACVLAGGHRAVIGSARYAVEWRHVTDARPTRDGCPPDT